MSQIRRRRLFVDAKLQGALLTHVALYWLYCLLSVGVIAIVWIVFAKRPPTSARLFEEVWTNCGPALLGSVVLMPLVLLDCLRMSNRFAGPMVRLQAALRELSNGGNPRPVKLREGDFWSSFADDVNRVIQQRSSLAGEKLIDAATASTEDTVHETVSPACRTSVSAAGTSIYGDVTA